jgi:thiol:disulfide interchange protein DsbC
MRTTLRLALGLFLWTAAAVAANKPMSVPANDPAPARIKAALEHAFDDVKIAQIRPAPWPGMYEVVTDTEIAYANADGTLLFSGHVIDIASKQDLTVKSWNAVNSIDFPSLPLELAIKTVKGDGSRTLAVFADPLCPFCKQLEGELAQINNVTIYTFLYPLETLHPGATEKAKQIWCSADRSVAWTQWMLKQSAVDEKTNCDTRALLTIRGLGEELKVTATPTLFFRDGHRFSGTLAKSDIEQQLSLVAAR